MFLYYDEHLAAITLIPSLTLIADSCECGCGNVYLITLDFLIWSVGIGWQP